MAPLEMRPEVGTPLVTEGAWPLAETLPVATVPCATEYTSPSAPSIGVTSKVPPSRLLASPSAETVTSICPPCRAKGGSVAVTITAATFLVRRLLSRALTPSRSSMPMRLSRVKIALLRVSPVPLSPTTSP